jgi:hypothetical protein
MHLENSIDRDIKKIVCSLQKCYNDSTNKTLKALQRRLHTMSKIITQKAEENK